ncbi:MAG: T9SS type A sorting domain-containing protein [candidate division Zixibacteria bacterium]|nr:T9SS type A sorting domain-containing protein [candidate division Zixibacteria bacterium]
MRRLFLSILLLSWVASIFAQYPDVSIYDIQEVPPGGDESLLLDDTVYVCGIVTVGTGIYYAGSGATFYLQDSEGGPFSGIIAYCPDSDSIPSLVPGDSVCFLGVISEYSWPYDPPYSSSMTEIFIFWESFELISHGHPLPEPMIITAEEIDSSEADSLAEQYEACLVRVCYATVDSVIPYTSTSTWICHDTTDHRFMVRDASDSIDYLPPPGTHFRYVQGVIYHRFNNFNVQPAYMSHLELFGYPGHFWHWPEYPVEGDTVYFYLVPFEDFEIVRATLYYRLNIAPFSSEDMIPITDTLYNCFIPPMEDSTRVDYYLVMEDSSGNIRTEPTEAPWNFYTFWVEEPVGIADKEPSLPKSIILNQNYPNPFNASTTLSFILPDASFVTLSVYDLLGHRVATLVETYLSSGYHSVSFDMPELASGLYFYQIRAGDYTESMKMHLLK